MLTPYEALLKSFLASRDTKVGTVGGRPICMFGVNSPSLLSDLGFIWMLGSPEIEKFSCAFLRRNRTYVRAQARKFKRLGNVVDARNSVSIRWLSWLGFKIYPAVPFGPFNLPFHWFEMRAS